MHWYEKESNRNRLQKIEQAIMARKFPQFSLFLGGGKYRFAGPGILFWGGRLRTNFGNAYMVAVTYPENFPYGQIKSYIPSLIGRPTPHKYVDGHLCLYSNDHGGKGEGIGRETTAATIVGWTAAWLNAWEVYKRTGKWPGK
jgi:hypothetical protein